MYESLWLIRMTDSEVNVINVLMFKGECMKIFTLTRKKESETNVRKAQAHQEEGM